MKQQQNFSVINFSREDVPIVTEDTKTRQQWIPVGVNDTDDFFNLLTEAYNTSTTNAACIDGVSDLIYGKGIKTDDTTFEMELYKLIPAEDLRRVSFDLKLYGNAAFQVLWNKDHTKITRMYHVPVQTLRAEKLVSSTKVLNYFYCTDWDDTRKHREKITIPTFGTSEESMEILYIKEYEPNRFYYSLPDWISALQFSFSEAELSNLHLNNIENGFLPMAMVNFNNGVPAPEERQTIESLLESKFSGTRNAGRFMVSFNDDPLTKPTVDVIPMENLHEKYTYVAEYAQDRILVAHRIVSPLLFGIRTASNGFSSQADEMKTAYSIMMTMTIQPFQSILLDSVNKAFIEGGIGKKDLYFEQLTPLVILSDTAEETDSSIKEVEDDVNESMENDNTTDENLSTELKKEPKHLRFSDFGFNKDFETEYINE
mgnify:CR=1 FL=1|tara:strand:+ start:2933 stop:4216 length:1284 start_codon:yes stop_codon:yes gene_type:complete